MQDDQKVLYKKAQDSADSFILKIKDDQWENETPCSEWNLKALINHLVNENLWTPELLAGKTLEEVGNAFDGDLLGEDPKQAWLQSASEALSAIADIQDFQKKVNVSWGKISAEEYVDQLILDKLIHGWDAAKATGQETQLDPEIVEYVYRTTKPHEAMLRQSGAFGEAVEVDENADMQTKLLGLLGRKI